MGDEPKQPAALVTDENGVLIPFEVGGVGMAYLTREDLAHVVHLVAKRVAVDAEAPTAADAEAPEAPAD